MSAEPRPRTRPHPRRRTPRLLALALLAVLLAPLASAALPLPQTEVEDAFIVRFERLPPDLDAGDPFAGGRIVRVDPTLHFAVVAAPPLRALGLRVEPGVLDIERDAEVRVMGAPDPLQERQYALAQIRAPEAWSRETGSADVRICIVDTGVRHTHEDLRGARWLGGIDFENQDYDPMDDHGHGTHVAGIAAASTGNGVGVAGVAQAGILGVKVLDETGGGRVSSVASGIRWCADHGARIISLSLGLRQPVSVLEDAVRYADAKGALLVAAGGNDGACTDCINWPAAYPEVLAVTCTDAQERPCGFSSQGRQTELSAPGHAILSTYTTSDREYAHMSGTSMAAPHVSGVAALLWSARPDLRADEVRALLTRSARDAGASGHDERYGHGIVDAAAALAAAGAESPPVEPEPQPEPAPAPQPEPAPAPEPTPQPDPNAAPVAHAGQDLRAFDPDGDRLARVVLDGTGSHDPDGRIVSHEWYRYSRLVGTGATPEVELRTGRHTLTLVVTDDEGATASDEVRVVVERNQKPTAGFTSRCDGRTCTFDAGASSDPEGSALAYAWKFGRAEASGRVVTHTFDEAGRQRVALQVTDPAGASQRERATLFVTPDQARTTYQEDFESGISGWTLTAGRDEAAPNLWRLASDCAVESRGGHALAFNRAAPACDRDVGASGGAVVSPRIDLKDAATAALRFEHVRDVLDAERSSDRLRVEVSSDEGRRWRTLEEWRPRDAGPASWHEVTLDLGRYAGEEVRVRFLFESRSERGNGGAGWSVDDVRVLVS